MQKPFEFATKIVKQWGTLVTSGAIIGALGISQGLGHPVRPEVYLAVALMGFVVASYRVWLIENDLRLTTEKRTYDGQSQLSLEALRFSGKGWDDADYVFTIQNIGHRAAMDVRFKPMEHDTWTLQLNNVGTLVPDVKTPVGFKVSNCLGEMEQTLFSLRRFFEVASRDMGSATVQFSVEAHFVDPTGEAMTDKFVLYCEMPDLRISIRPYVKQLP